MGVLNCNSNNIAQPDQQRESNSQGRGKQKMKKTRRKREKVRLEKLLADEMDGES